MCKAVKKLNTMPVEFTFILLQISMLGCKAVVSTILSFIAHAEIVSVFITAVLVVYQLLVVF